MQEVALQSLVCKKCYLKAWLRAALLCAVIVPQVIVFLAAVNHPGLVAAHVHTVAKHIRYMAYAAWNGLISQVVLVHRNGRRRWRNPFSLFALTVRAQSCTLRSFICPKLLQKHSNRQQAVFALWLTQRFCVTSV